MAIWDRFRRQPPRSPTRGWGLTLPSSPFRGSHTLSNSEVIFSAVNRISTTFGAMPCGVYDGYKADLDSPLGRMIAYSPNANMTPFEFFRTLEVDRNTDGNGYALIVPTLAGGIAEFMPLDPGRVQPMIEEESGELWYQVMLPDAQRARTVYVHNMQMIHVKHISTDGIQGISPLRVLAGTLDYAAQIAKFSLDSLEYGVHAGLVLEFPTEISDEKKMRSVKSFLDVYKASKGQLIALDAGVRATRMDSNLVDAKLLDVDRITRSRVAAVYTLPPHMLGDYSNSSYSGMEQENLEFLTLTMTPITELYRQEFNRKTLTGDMQRGGRSYRWDKTALLQADSRSRAEYYTKMVRSMGMMPNEVRSREGLPPTPEGDKLYGSRDLAPADMLGQISTVTTQGAGVQTEPDGGDDK